MLRCTTIFKCVFSLVVGFLMQPNCDAQAWPVKDDIDKAFASRRNVIPEFRLERSGSVAARTGVDDVYSLKDDLYEKLSVEPQELISIMLVLPEVGKVALDLMQVGHGPYRFTENMALDRIDVHIPITYRGVVRGRSDKNAVLLTVAGSGLSLSIYTLDGNWKLFPHQIDSIVNRFARQYLLVSAESLDSAEPILDCGTQDYTIKSGSDLIDPRGRSLAPEDHCVYVFIECFDSLFQWRNSSYQATIDFVFELFNHVANGYWNENINLKMSTINVWTTMDPYNQPSREQALADLSAFYQDNYWGNICVGLDYSLSTFGRSGLAGDIGRVKGEFPNVCPVYTVADHSFCYNDLNYNVNVIDFPSGPVSTQPMVYLVMHEIGHLLGSFHTQWCGWDLGGGNFGAIDNCAAPEGNCPPGQDPGNTGGTIMSYCVLGTDTTSYLNGFGPLPGAAIRSFVDNAACISECVDCPSTATINFSDVFIPGTVYRYEVSSTISATGELISTEFAVMDAGTSVTLTPGFRANTGANVRIFVDGCGGIR